MLNHRLLPRYYGDVPHKIIFLRQQGPNKFLFKFVAAVKQSAMFDTCFFFFAARAPIWALAYLHETLCFTSVI
jgi:hypothetical protein